MKKVYIFILFILVAIQGKSQQDPQYNLYQFNQMIINPAYAGARDAIATIASVRNQWVGFDGAPKTVCLSIHAPVFNKKLGAGLTIVNDAMGPRSMFGVYGNVAYILKLSSKFKLSFGLNAGYNRYQFNFSKLTYKTAESFSYLNQNQTYNKLDLNSGLFLRSHTFFAGVSVAHLFSSDFFHLDSAGMHSLTYRLRTHAFITIGNSFKISDNLIFAPTILLKTVGQVKSLDVNLNFFLFKKLWLGAFYRGGYGPGALLQYYITDKFRVAYSFDTGLNDARNLGGSHEVMIGFDFSGSKAKVVSPRFL